MRRSPRNVVVADLNFPLIDQRKAFMNASGTVQSSRIVKPAYSIMRLARIPLGDSPDLWK